MEQTTKRQLAVFGYDFYGPLASLRAVRARKKIEAAPKVEGEELEFYRSPMVLSLPYTWFYCRMKVYITCSHVATLRGRSHHAKVLENLTGIKKWRYNDRPPDTSS